VQRQFNGQTLQAPREIPKQVAMITEDQLAPLTGNGVVGGLDSGIIGGLGPSLGGGIGQAPPPPPPPPPVKEVKPKQEGPVRQSSGVQAAKCVNCPKPAYPPIAKQARIQGAVVLSAIIAKDGTVEKLTVVSSSNPLLTPAAMEAVKKWVYIPTILNTEPVEVATEITVNFTLQ
jgi:periplasmic protein TonB